MIDYSLCRNKLKENIEKIGKRDAKKIREGDNVYQLRIKTELNSFLGLSKPIPIEDVENRILKPSMQNMDAWSCGFSYRIPEIKKKDERIVALYLHLNEDNQKIEYRKTKDTNKDIRRDFVVKEEHKKGVVDLADLDEAQYNKIMKLIKNKEDELNRGNKGKRKKVSAWNRLELFLEWCYSENILTSDSSVKCCSSYISTKIKEHFKSTERFYAIFQVGGGSYKGAEITTLLDNMQGELITRPDIPLKIMIHEEKDYTRVDFVRVENKEDLHLIDASVTTKQKEQRLVDLIKEYPEKQCFNKRFFINYVFGNSSGYYCNDNSTVKVCNEIMRTNEFRNEYGIEMEVFNYYKDKEGNDTDKPRKVFKKIRKGPDWDDIYFIFNGEYKPELKTKINFEKLQNNTAQIEKIRGEKQMKKVEMEEPVKEPVEEVKVKREKQTYTKEFHKYAIEVLDREGITEKYLKEQPLSVNVDGALVVKTMKDKFTEYADVDDKKMWKGIRQLDLVNRFKGKSKKRELNKIVKVKEKAVKVKEVKPKTTKTKVAEKKEEFEIIHIVRFVTNLKFKTEVKAEIEVGLFKKKKTKQVPVEFMKHYEEIVMYCGKEKKDEEVVEDKMRELINITSQEGKLVSITAQSMPNGKTYSIIDSKTFEVKKGE